MAKIAQYFYAVFLASPYVVEARSLAELAGRWYAGGGTVKD